MDTNVEQIQAELNELAEGFAKYFSVIEEAFQKNWNHQYDETSLASAHLASADSLKSEREDLHLRLDRVCGLYLTASEQVRELLRQYAGSRRSLLLALREHVGWCAGHITSVSNREFLRNALGAASLQDNRLDFRDNYLALGDLYLTSVKAGIHPTMDFYKIGLLSSSQSRTQRPDDTTRNFLTAFEESAYFKESVAPRLADGPR